VVAIPVPFWSEPSKTINRANPGGPEVKRRRVKTFQYTPDYTRPLEHRVTSNRNERRAGRAPAGKEFDRLLTHP